MHLIKLPIAGRPFSVIFLMMLFAACNGPKFVDMPRYNAVDIKVQISNGILLSEGKPFTGVIYTMQQDQRDTAEIVGFNQGREHGTWKRFYPDGRLMEQRQFADGKKVGEYKAWWPNGKQKLIFHFADGEYEGNCRAWAINGILVEDMNYKQGHEEGRQRQYYEDGRVKANYLIADGRRYGLLGTKNCKNVTDSVFKN